MSFANRSRSGGGSATAGGMNFQHRVASWIAVHVLAEAESSPPWELPASTTLEWLRCETEQPVDDLMVGTSADGFVFAQVKHTLQLSSSPSSSLVSVIDQFVRQALAHQISSQGSNPWDRTLDPEKDRLALIVGPNSSNPIRIHLPAILERVRGRLQDQPLEEMPANNQEQKALSAVLGLTRSTWQAVQGKPPTDVEIQRLLSLIHVHVLDVDNGGYAEREAKDRLRSAVLVDPDQADLAWGRLIDFCAELAAGSSGADRARFQRVLLNAGIDLQVPQSSRNDIEWLKDYTLRTTSLLADLAIIPVGSEIVKFQRPSTQELRRIAEESSVLVIGEPGAGKSGALHDLVELLREEQRDAVFLAVDHLASRSLAKLQTELGLERDLVKILNNWPGSEPAFLVIDALDAARDDSAASAIRDLILLIFQENNRWHVVASIREYDIRHNTELRQLFRGKVETEFIDSDLRDIKHIKIPLLSDEELEQIQSQSSNLQSLLESSPSELHELLRIPFNLRLMGELLGAGADLAILTPIRSQIELLDRYWSYRVIREDRQGDERERLLRRVCEEMVNNRSLRVDRSLITDPMSGAYLEDLLSAHIVINWRPSPSASPDRYVLTFAHHVLYDYAIARLLLRGTAEQLVSRFSNDPELALTIRPSLIMQFQHIWYADRDRQLFWNLVFQFIGDRNIPEIGKLIGPAIAAELVLELSDLEPLCAAIESTIIDTQVLAERALRHLVGSLLASSSTEMPLVGAISGPWSILLARISRTLREPLAYAIRPLLIATTEKPEILTSDQRSDLGLTARRLLDYAWTHGRRDRWLAIHALESVCRTFESDSTASAALIRRSLEPEHLLKYGFEEMPRLADNVKRLLLIDPDLVEEIYQVVFSYQEESGEQTSVTESRIIGMISTRQQDYSLGLYLLAEVYPKFLVHSPINAIRALVTVIESYVNQRHPPSSGEVIEESFEFNGESTRIRTDYSAIWDTNRTYRHDDPLKMLDAFEEYIAGLASDKNKTELLREIIWLLIVTNRLAVLWRRLLLFGTQYPDVIGREILPLAWSIPILTGYDTYHAAGDFIKAIFPNLPSEKQEKIERAILSIPELYPEDRQEAGEKLRNQLLGCAAGSTLVTEDARRLIAVLEAADSVPSNVPPVSIGKAVSGAYGEEEFLEEEGVPVHEEPNRRIRDLEKPVKEFSNKHQNSVPTADTVISAFPDLQKLRIAVEHADDEGIHPKQRDYAYGYLAAACSCIAKMDELSCIEEVGRFVKSFLLEASHHVNPIPNPDDDARFDEHPSWGSHQARTEAAEGLTLLARHPSCCTENVLKAVDQLSRDPVPAVRFQVAVRLNVLARQQPDFMWQIIERMCKEEPRRGILQWLVSSSLSRIARAQPDQAGNLAKQIFDRVQEGLGAENVRESCIDLFTSLYVWRGNEMGGKIVSEVVSDPVANADEAHYVLSQLRDPLTYGPVYPSDSSKDAIRGRAFDLMTRLFHSARVSLRELEARYPGSSVDTWTQRDRESLRSILRLIDEIGSHIYFASGAFDREKHKGTTSGISVSEEQKRFYHESTPLLDELAVVGLPSLAHHLLETLEAFIPLDPPGVFLRIGRVIQAGQEGGYQFESLAAGLFVKLTERYLAEYRSLFQQSEDCRRTLLEILDIFVEAGWPSARRLTYRLEELFR